MIAAGSTDSFEGWKVALSCNLRCNTEETAKENNTCTHTYINIFIYNSFNDKKVNLRSSANDGPMLRLDRTHSIHRQGNVAVRIENGYIDAQYPYFDYTVCLLKAFDGARLFSRRLLSRCLNIL